MMNIIEQRSGVGIKLSKGERIKITDIEGQQVCDLFCVFKEDKMDYLSSGRTLDYLGRINFKEGDSLYSSKSKPMLKIIEDTVKSHDFMLTPCSKDTFRLLYDNYECSFGCEENLISVFDELGVKFESLPVTFNTFMNVEINSSGALKVATPLSKTGDYIVFEALDDLFVGLTSCSAPQSNGGFFKPIGYEVL